jgi:hypothetical protein
VDLKPSAMRDGKARLKNRQFYQIPKNNQVSIMALALRGARGHGDLAAYAILENYLFCAIDRARQTQVINFNLEF